MYTIHIKLLITDSFHRACIFCGTNSALLFYQTQKPGACSLVGSISKAVYTVAGIVWIHLSWSADHSLWASAESNLVEETLMVPSADVAVRNAVVWLCVIAWGRIQRLRSEFFSEQKTWLLLLALFNLEKTLIYFFHSYCSTQCASKYRFFEEIHMGLIKPI